MRAIFTKINPHNLRLFSIVASRVVFIPVVTLLLLMLHLEITQDVMKLSSYPVKFIKREVDLIAQYPDIWEKVKIAYKIISAFGIAIAMDILYRMTFGRFLNKAKPENKIEEEEIRTPKYPYDVEKLQMIIGVKHKKFDIEKVKEPKWVIVPELGMYQNFLITGTIGTGKTASGMYPFLKQAMFYKYYEPQLKAGMLILDVKGNFYKKVVDFAKEASREQDIIIIELNGQYKYNPMHKLNLKPLVLANRVKTVLTLFSPKGATDGYWLDKAELLIAECIKLSRLYNNNYVTFTEINRLVNNRSYLDEKLSILLELYEQRQMSEEQELDFETSKDYFENEYTYLSENTLSIIQSVVTQMTQTFYTDFEVRQTFCPPVDKLNFHGFKDVVDKGKIVILKMNNAQYKNLSKTIAAYMKLDFQSEVMQRLVREGANRERPVFMFSDEYQEFVTATDAEFYAQSREPKCVSVVATQTYTSLISSLKDRDMVRAITQNLINKIWLRTDDSFTVEEAQKQLGRDDKEKVSRSISESSGDVTKSKILGTLVSDKASVSESLNVTTIREFIFDSKVFTQILKVFTGVCFLSDGEQILEPSIVYLMPYYGETISKGIQAIRGNGIGRGDRESESDRGRSREIGIEIDKEVDRDTAYYQQSNEINMNNNISQNEYKNEHKNISEAHALRGNFYSKNGVDDEYESINEIERIRNEESSKIKTNTKNQYEDINDFV